MFKLSKLCLPLLLLLIPAFGYAESSNIFKPAPLDISYYILQIFYGKVDGVLHGQNAVLAKMFAVFNSAALIFASVVLVYVLIVSTINTANDGEMLGKKWSSMWVPIKLVIGVILLIPKASGYSIIQVIVMWIVVMGVGVADTTWKAMVTHFASGGNLLSSAASNPMALNSPMNWRAFDLSAGILKSTVCVKALEKELKARADKLKMPDLARIDLMNTVYSQLQTGNITKNGDQFIIYFPNGIKEMPELQGVCGAVKWSDVSANDFCNSYSDYAKQACQKYLKDNPKAVDQLRSANGLQGSIPVAIQSILTAQLQAADAVVRSSGQLLHPERWGYNRSATVITTTGIAMPGYTVMLGSPLINGVTNYNAILGARLADFSVTFQTTAQNILSESAINFIKDGGWILAGSFANNLMTRYTPERTINFAERYIPEYQEGKQSFPGMDDATSQDIYKLSFANPLTEYIQIVYGKNINEGRVSIDFVTIIDKGFITPFVNYVGDIEVGSWPFKIKVPGWMLDDMRNKLVSIARDFGTFFDNIFVQISTILNINTIASMVIVRLNVLHGLTVLGQLLLTGASIIYFLISIIASLLITLLGFIPTLDLPIGPAVFFMSYFPFVLTFFGTLIVTGAMLAYYIPLLPLIIFTFGIMGWLVGVFESLIAAPIVAIGIMMPEGHDNFMGKATPAIMLILNLFLRPTLMLFGLVGGLILANISVWLFLLLFSIMIMAMAGFSMGDFSNFISGDKDPTTIINGIIAGLNLAYIVIGFTAYIIIIVATVLSIVKKSFSLIHSVPDKIMQWLSGGIQQSLGSDMSAGSQEVGDSFRAGMGTVKEQISGRLKGNHEQNIEKLNKQGQKGKQDSLSGGGDKNT